MVTFCKLSSFGMGTSVYSVSGFRLVMSVLYDSVVMVCGSVPSLRKEFTKLCGVPSIPCGELQLTVSDVAITELTVNFSGPRTSLIMVFKYASVLHSLLSPYSTVAGSGF